MREVPLRKVPVCDMPIVECDATSHTSCHALRNIIQQLLRQFIPHLCQLCLSNWCGNYNGSRKRDMGKRSVGRNFHLEQQLSTRVKSFKSLISAIT
ncbi:hypothetical protein AVEN_51822-1 [Araneus ventricosus]|uniref:Uncharacterized protein n=1 Tax=Araneus ventricosus TaxID=182803 RepID=A0A4Y2H3E4_ARAVE|nr:hypothetical protein AVEN_51822-1 [Araneus ventricosus]